MTIKIFIQCLKPSFSYFLSSGTSADRRRAEIRRLNSEFQAMVKMNLSLQGILHFMIETENYRMLSTQEYSWRESPLRSGRLGERTAATQPVPSTSRCVRVKIEGARSQPQMDQQHQQQHQEPQIVQQQHQEPQIVQQQQQHQEPQMDQHQNQHQEPQMIQQQHQEPHQQDQQQQENELEQEGPLSKISTQLPESQGVLEIPETQYSQILIPSSQQQQEPEAYGLPSSLDLLFDVQEEQQQQQPQQQHQQPQQQHQQSQHHQQQQQPKAEVQQKDGHLEQQNNQVTTQNGPDSVENLDKEISKLRRSLITFSSDVDKFKEVI